MQIRKLISVEPSVPVRDRRFVLVAAGLTVAIVLVVSSGLDLDRAISNTEALYGKRVLGLSLQGDLQYATQESRRMFLYVLMTAGWREQLGWIDRVRDADQKVSLLTGKSILLDLGPRETAQLHAFEARWSQYQEVRDNIIALTLQGRTEEAHRLERTEAGRDFDQAKEAIRSLKAQIDAVAYEEQMSIKRSFYRALAELAGLLLATILCIVRLAVMNKREHHFAKKLETKNALISMSERLERQRNQVLEQIGRNEPLETIFEGVLRLIHQQWLECSSCISLLRAGQLQVVASNHMPSGLQAEIERMDLGLEGPSANEARDERSIERRVLSACRDACLGFQPEFHVRPILSSAGRVLGVMTVGFSAPREQSDLEAGALDAAARLVALAAEQRELHSELTFQAHHDLLTELPNRAVFRDRLEKAIAAAESEGTCVGVLWLDVDRFKHVNDTFGHRAGDLLLRAVARRLEACIRSSDTVARIGGDEFTVLLPGIPITADAIAAAQRILDAFHAPFAVLGHQLSVSVSVGVSVFPEHGQDATVLIRHADAALYLAKSSGRGGFAVYAPELTAQSEEQLEIEQELSRALENGEFHIEYQPQLDSKGRILAAEALLRWQNPRLGKIPPARFIPVAEQSGLIVPIGAWVLNEACRQAAAWARSGLACRVAVNVSAVQFSRSDFVTTVADALASSGLKPDLLDLELTESAIIMNLSYAGSQMIRLRNIGVDISIDDFGTGYCSLAYVQQLPISTLKLDQCFVRGVDGPSGESAAVVQAVLTMAKSLNLRTVAEGVETEGQLKFLRKTGCDLFQGYLFYRPLHPFKIENLLRGGAGKLDGRALLAEAPVHGAPEYPTLEAVAG
jgi:diguanylate cyclase (GGDEF)-like protein